MRGRPWPQSAEEFFLPQWGDLVHNPLDVLINPFHHSLPIIHGSQLLLGLPQAYHQVVVAHTVFLREVSEEEARTRQDWKWAHGTLGQNSRA